MIGFIVLFILGVILVLVGLLGTSFLKDIVWADFYDMVFGLLVMLISLIAVLLGAFLIILSFTSSSNTVPYKERYVTKCEMMGGTYRSESIYNVATKTHRESHYCNIRGFEFEDIGA